MGIEANCTAKTSGKTSQGRAELSGEEVSFRGDFRVRLALKEVSSVEFSSGWLHLGHKEGRLSLELGPAAEKWAARIRNPRSRADKLGVKPGLLVSALAGTEPTLLAEISSAGAVLSSGRVKKGSDLIFFPVLHTRDLSRMRSLREGLKPEGALWVLWRKGQKDLREDDIRAAGPSSGLVDVKVASLSLEWSGLKMVIPLSLRPAAKKAVRRPAPKR